VWRSADGSRSEEGAFAFANDGYVHVILRDGTSRKVPLAALSEADKSYVASKQKITGGLFEADDEVTTLAGKRVVVNKPIIAPALLPDEMSPDQEAYNNLMAIAYALESRPPLADDYAAFKLLRTERLSQQMRDKTRDFGDLLNKLQAIEQSIAKRKREAESQISGATFEKGFSGGLEAAGTLAQVDVAANGEPAAGALAYMVAGAIGGAIRAQQATAAIQEEADAECRSMRQNQAAMAKEWTRGMEELAAGPFGRQFIAGRVLTNDSAAILGKDTKGVRAAQRLGDLIRLRVASMSVLLCELENSNAIDPNRKLPSPDEWQELVDLAIAEWPKCVEQRCPQYASLHKMRAKALLDQEKYLDAEKSIGVAISMFGKDDDAYVTRARLCYSTGKTAEGIRDVRAAIKIRPDNSWYRIYKAFGHAIEKDTANCTASLKEAYGLGWHDVDYIRSRDLFKAFSKDPEFTRLTTVKWSWHSKPGLLAGDVYLRNESPFAITNVKLKIQGSAQQPVLEAARIGPGEQMHWQWIDNTAADAQKASMGCDQHP
jgi:hypothetical protein